MMKMIHNECSQDDDKNDIYEASVHSASSLLSVSDSLPDSDCLNSDHIDDNDFSQEI